MKPENNKGPVPLVPSSCSVPLEAYVGKAVPAATIQAATSKRCKVLGVGGFGKVFAGELPGLPGSSGSSKVAIKVATSGGVPALIHEATIMRLAAAHPNVASLLGSCWEEGHEALITEYCPGSDLDHYIGCFTQQQQQQRQPAAAVPKGTPAASTAAISSSSSKPEAVRVPKVRQLGWMERLRVTYQVAAALAFMHQGCGVGQQVLHLDIKPGNVLLDAAGNAKLIDFGIARVVSTAAAGAAAATGHGPGAAPVPAANGHSSHPTSQHQQHHQAHPHGANNSSRPGSARDHHHSHHSAAGLAAGSGCGRKCPASAAEAKLAALAARGVGQGQVLQDQGWAGTPDYLDPLYEQLGQLCDRSDVYSLGLIMCQLLLDNPEPQDAHHILAHAARQKALHLPKGLEAWPADSAAAYAALALRCCSMQREARPTSQQLLAALLPLVRAAGIIGGTPADAAAGGQLSEGCWEFMAAVEAVPAAVQAAAANSSSSSGQGPPRLPQVPATAATAAAPGQLVRGTQAPPGAMPGCKAAWGKQVPSAPAAVIPAGAPAAEAWPSLGGLKPGAPGLHHGVLPAAGIGSTSSSAKALHRPEPQANSGRAPVPAAGMGAQQGACSWAVASKGLVLSVQVVIQAGGTVTGQLVLPLAPTRGAAAAGAQQSSVNSSAGSKPGSATTSVSVSIDGGSYDASCGQIRFSAGLDSAATAAAQAAMKALGVAPAVQASSAAAAGKAGCDRAPSGVTRVSPGPSLQFLGTYQQGVLQGSWELCTPAAGSSSTSSVWRMTSSYLWAAYTPPKGPVQSTTSEQAPITAAAAGVSSQPAATAPAVSPFAAAGAGAGGAPPAVDVLTPETVSAAVAAAVSATEQHLMRRLSSSCARQHSLRADGGRQHSLNMVQPL